MSHDQPVLLRMAWTLLLSASALLLLSPIVPGFAVDGAGWALLTAAIVGVVNATLWPLIVRVALPLTVLTLGGAALALDGALLFLVHLVVPGVEVRGLGSAVVVALGLAAITSAVGGAFMFDDDAGFRRRLLRRFRHAPAGERSAVPGVLFLEIDGLAYDVLRRALRDGDAPALARWLREGTHRLVRWETDLSSQTGACQAGILHGCNDDLPAFRWWDKEAGRALVTNHPRDAAEIERRVSDGRGLLHAGGSSRANILSGDAPHSSMTMSTVLDRDRPERLGAGYQTYFSRPSSTARTVVRVIAEVVRELRAADRQVRRDVAPCVRRGVKYAFLRAYATVIQMDLQVDAVLGDIVAGRPVVYTTFLAYDEVAHHSGLERADTLAVLRRVDEQIRRIHAAAAHGPRPYEVVVLSDHGQSQGATFLQRYGQTLEDLVRDACESGDVWSSDSGEDEAGGRLGAALTEAAGASRAVRTATRRRTVDGQVVVAETPVLDHVPEVVVMASGCLGLISFPAMPGRVTLEEIARAHPRLLPALRAHDGIGFVMVRNDAGEAIALGARGAHALRSGRVVGEDPLAPFGPRAARHLLRTDGFASCPDILVNSRWWPETEEVAAFEELVGSHGGLGGPQSFPFLMAPSHFAFPAQDIVGAEHVHDVLVGWLADLGHPAHG